MNIWQKKVPLLNLQKKNSYQDPFHQQEWQSYVCTMHVSANWLLPFGNLLTEGPEVEKIKYADEWFIKMSKIIKSYYI